MQSLADFLAEQLKFTSSRELAALTGVTHTTIQRMARAPLQNTPSIDTLQRLAKAFNLPMWHILEMAGVNLELPATFETDLQKVMSLAEKQASLGDIVRQLAATNPKDLAAIRQFLAVQGTKNRVYEIVHFLRGEMPELTQALLRTGQELGIPMPHKNEYTGERSSIDDKALKAIVRVNGEPLIDLLGWDVGVEWGYGGAGPRNLARAIFSYEFQSAEHFPAQRYAGYFFSYVTTQLPREVGGIEWKLTSTEIYLWVTLMKLAKLVSEEQAFFDDENSTV
jgi:transcriptional regulator with XRE-family HTH domain